jgi:RNA polymerase sigma-70 factor (ECF subfamily)
MITQSRGESDAATAMEAFADDVYREHGPAVLRLATRLCAGDRGLAEDVLQETMLRAWRHAPELGASGRPLRPWLFTVARRVAMNHARTRRARPPETGEAALETVPVADSVDRLLTALALREAAARLSVEHRMVLMAVCCLGAPVREVAEAAGVPAGTVKSRTHYALRALRAALTNDGGAASWATS